MSSLIYCLLARDLRYTKKIILGISNGFPRRSHVYEGNINESKTLSELLCNLEKGGTSTGQKSTVIMDAGIATEDNITWLKEHHYPYLVVSRKKHREFDEKTQETLLYCHSTMREKKDQAIGDRFINRFEQELQKLSNRLHKKRCFKKYDKIMVKIGGLRQKFSKVSGRYTITVKKDEKSGNATELNWIQEPKPETTDTHPGVYCKYPRNSFDTKQGNSIYAV